MIRNYIRVILIKSQASSCEHVGRQIQISKKLG